MTRTMSEQLLAMEQRIDGGLIECEVPVEDRVPLRRWIMHGEWPEDAFLQAVLENDFVKAVVSTDATRGAYIDAYANFLNEYALVDCWGGGGDYPARDYWTGYVDRLKWEEAGRPVTVVGSSA